jgi:hypothetical protein
MAGDSAQVDLTLDSKGFSSGLQAAERQSQRFSSNLKALGQKFPDVFGDPIVNSLNGASKSAQTFEGRLAGLFKRDPTAKAQRAFTGLAADLSSGNVAQGVAGFASRMSSLGLAAGVGIGAAIGIFQKFRGQAQETEKAISAVNKELAKPLSAQIGLGASALSDSIEAGNKALDNLIEKRRTIGSKLAEAGQIEFERQRETRLEPTAPIPDTGLWSRIREQFRQAGELEMQRQGTMKPPPGTIEDRFRTNAQVQAEFEERLRKSSSARADSEVKAVEAKIKGLTTSELDAKLALNALGAEKERSAIILQESQRRVRPGTDQLEDIRNMSKRLGAVRELAQAQDTATIEAAGNKSRQIAAEQNLANMAAEGVSIEDQKIARLQTELGLIQDQLAFNTQLTNEQKAQLQLQQTKAQTALKEAQFQQILNPAAGVSAHIEATKRAALMKAVMPQGFAPSYLGEQPYRDISGKLVPSPAKAGFAERPQEKSQDLVGAINELVSLTKQVWQ